MLSEPLLVVARLARAFDRLAIRYLVGGSLASSLHGIPRATQDVDLVVELQLEHVEPLVEALAGDFYIDQNMAQDAVRRHASFNVVHWETMFKADVFVSPRDAWSLEEMTRVRRELVDTPEGRIPINFASAEDTLLHKLLWYKLGNEVSERQWGDILGMLHIQGNSLDEQYLDEWGQVLGVSDLLLRARGQAQE
jgi:hypothetical protein